jgi:hypothetical protein
MVTFSRSRQDLPSPIQACADSFALLAELRQQIFFCFMGLRLASLGGATLRGSLFAHTCARWRGLGTAAIAAAPSHR